MRSGSALLLATLSALAVAAVAPPGVAQSAPETTTPSPSPAGAAASGVEDAIEQVTLSDAIARALARNPSVQTANAELARSRALLAESRAASLPTITANGIYTRLDAERTLPGAAPSPGASPAPARVIAGLESESANLTFAVPLFAPARWRNWAHAEDAVLVQGASTDEVKRQIALATGHAWLSVAAADRLVAVDVRAHDANEAHAKFARTRAKGGLGSRVDVVRAEQAAANAVTLLESARTSAVRAREALGVLLAAEGPVDASGADVPEPPALEDALRGAIEKRADVRAFELRRKLAKSISHDAWTDYVPYVSGQFAPFYQNPPSLTQPKTGWQAQLLLTWSLYDGGYRYGLERERRLLAREAALAWEGVARQAKAEVRGWEAAVTHADAALAAAKNAAKLAHEQLDLANLAYQAGATTDLEVIDAQRTALDADTNVAIAEDNARQARLELLAASGSFP